MQDQGNKGLFPPTSWSLVEQAGAAHDDGSIQALDQLLKRYMPALKAHLIGGRHLSPDQANELLQDFVTDKILMDKLLSQASKNRGKFRTFLLTSMDRYAISQYRKHNAGRRSPGKGYLLSMDAAPEVLSIPARSSSYSTTFDLAWIREVLNETLLRVKDICEKSGRDSFWVLFEDRVVKPALHGESSEKYASIVSRLHFASPMQASNALITVKRIFARTLRGVVQEYVGTEQNIEKEITELRAILSEITRNM